MPRAIFKNLVIALAGPIEENEFFPENVKRWTTFRKGRFVDRIDESVTHLICTQEHFDQRVPAVKAALRLKRIRILHWTWFFHSTSANRKEPWQEFCLRTPYNRKKTEERIKRLRREREERGRRNGERFVNTNLFHIYRDRENFAYEVTITRDDPDTGELGQRYILKLWESNAKPCLYWFSVKFLKYKGYSQPNYYTPSDCAGKWRPQMDLFLDFFRIKTGVDWQDRVTFERTKPPKLFQYTCPTGGKPVGRRLRFSYDYCREMNARLRGLPWPPVIETEAKQQAHGDANGDEMPVESTRIEKPVPIGECGMLTPPEAPIAEDGDDDPVD